MGILRLISPWRFNKLKKTRRKTAGRKKEYDHGSKLWLLGSYSDVGGEVAEKGEEEKSKQTSVHIYFLELPEHEVRDRRAGRRHDREELEQVEAVRRRWAGRIRLLSPVAAGMQLIHRWADRTDGSLDWVLQLPKHHIKYYWQLTYTQHKIIIFVVHKDLPVPSTNGTIGSGWFLSLKAAGPDIGA